MNHRLANLRALLRERKLDALFVTSDANARYLSGFSGSSGALLITEDIALLFTDSRYRIRAKREAPLFTLRESSVTAPIHRLLAEAIAEMGLQRVGFEANQMSVALYQRILDALRASVDNANPPTLSEADGLIEQLRAVKDADELAAIRRAVAITDAAFKAITPGLRPDQTEQQVAWMLEVAMRERGAEGLAFPIIVAAGPNAAQPHARAGDDRLGAGRPIIIDMGARVDGYHADLTRTIILGEPNEQFWNVYATVLEAQRQAITGVQAGMRAAEIDALARGVINAAGFGEHFGHGLGHGVGLAIHEAPSLRQTPPEQRDKSAQLQAGNVFSIEPGIYMESWGGVRIEDLALLHNDGVEILSQAPRLEPPSIR